MKKYWSVLASVGVLMASALGFQGAASAAPTTGPISIKAHPTGCSYEKFTPEGHQGASAKCTQSNGGHYKAIVVCVRSLNGDQVSREAATWQSGGRISVVWCPPETHAEFPGVMTKAS